MELKQYQSQHEESKVIRRKQFDSMSHLSNSASIGDRDFRGVQRSPERGLFRKSSRKLKKQHQQN